MTQWTVSEPYIYTLRPCEEMRAHAADRVERRRPGRTFAVVRRVGAR
jgi:hypothetical protein